MILPRGLGSLHGITPGRNGQLAGRGPGVARLETMKAHTNKSIFHRLASGLAVIGLLLANIVSGALAADVPPFRPPAVPLVTFNPYLSIWSEADHLTDDATRHWTRREHSLVSLIRVDGKAYRLMGNDPAGVPALPQVGLEVTPTRSIYDFEDGQVHVTLTFMTAALPDDLDVLARPLSYLTWQVRSVDGKAHAVSIYDSTSSQLAVNKPDEKVDWARENSGQSDGAARSARRNSRCSARAATTIASTGAMPTPPRRAPRPRRPSAPTRPCSGPSWSDGELAGAGRLAHAAGRQR